MHFSGNFALLNNKNLTYFSTSFGQLYITFPLIFKHRNKKVFDEKGMYVLIEYIKAKILLGQMLM